ncbi:hypothetical protein EJ08DRAFT_684486 [Tothia fuscella]|uniref:HIG1 domain-containing protein n=1 Tax=Tothia fuscella TaxID=1048955 RepID=A0A9P4P535_9PEZI|nr:hypothetical protein EJ08DRAFT_684486 [Tothia fuscella]
MSNSGAPMPSSFDDDVDFYSESRWQKFTRKLYQEPLVPLGCGLTVLALIGATRAMRSNDHVRTNIMFRRRIYAQAFTIVAIVAGSTYWKGDREKRKEFEEVEKERKRIEKREKWLNELELRDKEDREVLWRRLRRGRGLLRPKRVRTDSPPSQRNMPSLAL